MKHLKTTLMGAAIGGALLFAGQATAGPITVDGIEFSSGSNFQSTLIYENTVSAPGEELMGFGLITAINGDLDYCASGGSGDCELTFVFDGFVVDTIDPNHVTFDFGSVRFYADSMADFDGFDMSTAENGDLFLEATGHEYEDTDSGETGTLIATGSNLTTDQAQGSGVGYLDVVGGDAGSFFNTDTFRDFLGGMTDIQFNSTFSPNACENSTNQPICGSALVKSVAVPEPGMLGMFGFGLLMLGSVLRWRGKAR